MLFEEKRFVLEIYAHSATKRYFSKRVKTYYNFYFFFIISSYWLVIIDLELRTEAPVVLSRIGLSMGLWAPFGRHETALFTPVLLGVGHTLRHRL